MEERYFESQEAFRQWLEENHQTAAELWVGYYKKASGKGGLTYRQAVDEALCFGWIDGVVKAIDEHRYRQRFTPRRKGSNWSSVNIKRVAELTALGRMMPAGTKAFEERDPARVQQYSFEQPDRPGLPPEMIARFKEVPEAWDFFSSQAPSYQRIASWIVINAKREETKWRRLEALIEDSRRGKRIRQL